MVNKDYSEDLTKNIDLGILQVEIMWTETILKQNIFPNWILLFNTPTLHTLELTSSINENVLKELHWILSDLLPHSSEEINTNLNFDPIIYSSLIINQSIFTYISNEIFTNNIKPLLLENNKSQINLTVNIDCLDFANKTLRFFLLKNTRNNQNKYKDEFLKYIILNS